MQVKLTIGERLKDLRTAQKLTLEQLAAEVGISKSALGKYESDNGKDISPYSILVLADYYGVSCDYLMGRTETKNHPNTALHELHLSDASIDVLKTGKFNHRLLSELICHKDFQRFMLDAEIYVDRIADMRVNDMNAVLEAVRQMALMKNGGEENDLHNQGTNKAICEYMKEAGHTLFSAFTGSEALKIFRGEELDIIVLDIMLPEMSGIVVLHEIRKVSNIPVIMLTALDDEYTQSNSFDEMADDYITKPFSMLILGKRITALLRRSQSKPAVNMIKLGDVTVDFSGYTACDENGKIDITPKELEILKVLIDNKGLVLSRNQILDDVWGYDCDVIDRTIDAYIRNIRKKLRLDCITTVKGIGYKFEMGQEI